MKRRKTKETPLPMHTPPIHPPTPLCQLEHYPYKTPNPNPTLLLDKGKMLLSKVSSSTYIHTKV